MDVKSFFLHGDLTEEIYMEKPLCFTKYSNLVCELKKSLYGLKQDPQDWYKKIDHFSINLEFKHCKYDHSIYVLHVQGDTLIFVVYVDDLVSIRNKHDLIFRLKN